MELASTAALPRFRLPRVYATRPQPGWFHPAPPSAVRAFLRQLGPACFYGLQSIHLEQPAGDRSLNGSAPRLRLGVLALPGRLSLFAQPIPPWQLPFQLAPEDRATLETAGARIVDTAMGTQVFWPGDTLCQFVLHEVLLHELGHHVLQHERRKRREAAARRRDHEAFAVLFSRRIQEQLRRTCTEMLPS